MAEDGKTPRAGALGLLDDLRAELRKKTLSAVAGIILSGVAVLSAAVLGAIATGLVSVPERAIGALQGALGVALLLVAGLLLVRILSRAKKAPREVVEQFRAFHHTLDSAVQWAIDLLGAGICASAPAGKETVVDLVRDLVPVCEGNRAELAKCVVPGDWTESRLDEAIRRASALLNDDYKRLTSWVRRAGGEILTGQDFVSMTGYVELRHRHWELFDQARKIRTHSRLGAIVPTLEIEGFFPGLARQGSTTYIEGMSAGELLAHVRSEGAREFIGREWSPPERLTITGRQAKALDCRTAGGYPILLPDLDPKDLDHLMQPGNRIYVWGTIKEAEEKHILLSPAEVIKVESD